MDLSSADPAYVQALVIHVCGGGVTMVIHKITAELYSSDGDFLQPRELSRHTVRRIQVLLLVSSHAR